MTFPSKAERNLKIFVTRQHKAKYEEIAALFGVSVARVHKIYERAQDKLIPLSVRAPKEALSQGHSPLLLAVATEVLEFKAYRVWKCQKCGQRGHIDADFALKGALFEGNCPVEARSDSDEDGEPD